MTRQEATNREGPCVAPELEGRWLIEWTKSGLLGQTISFKNMVTGERLSGRAHTGWENALSKAMALRTRTREGVLAASGSRRHRKRHRRHTRVRRATEALDRRSEVWKDAVGPGFAVGVSRQITKLIGRTECCQGI